MGHAVPLSDFDLGLFLHELRVGGHRDDNHSVFCRFQDDRLGGDLGHGSHEVLHVSMSECLLSKQNRSDDQQ